MRRSLPLNPNVQDIEQEARHLLQDFASKAENSVRPIADVIPANESKA